jgi:general secretion pathway protein C
VSACSDTGISAKLPRPGLQGGRAVLPLLLGLLLALALVFRLGLGARELLAPATPTLATDTSVTNTLVDTTGVDLAAIQSMNLFGSTSANVSAQSQPALPASTQVADLRLEGVVLAQDPARSIAFIRSQGRQLAYRTGDELSNGAVVLKEVARDHAILERRGEVLRLDLHTRELVRSADPAPVMPMSTRFSTGLPSINQDNLGQALQAVNEAMNLASLAEIMEVTPAQENGRLIGYRLSPGVRLKDFVQLGLRTGDIVTAVNGIPLDDLGALQSLRGLMNDSTEVSFSLLREGQVRNLRISLQELANTSRRPADAANNMERP